MLSIAMLPIFHTMNILSAWEGDKTAYCGATVTRSQAQTTPRTPRVPQTTQWIAPDNHESFPMNGNPDMRVIADTNLWTSLDSLITHYSSMPSDMHHEI